MIASIVVTYNPDALPEELCSVLARHCEIILADNSTEASIRGRLQQWAQKAGFHFVDMRGNTGIAAAQNAALQIARRRGSFGVIFFDQDSKVDDVAVIALKGAILTEERSVFALSPGVYSSPNANPPKCIPIRELMSSGSGCRLSVFEAVGDFEEQLFIDCVDFEWGWRCRRKGIILAGLRAGVFLHKLGKSEVRFFGMRAHMDSPVRLYYQFRNIVVMMRRNYVPVRWKVRQTVRSLGKLLIVLILYPNRSVMALRGVRDGLLEQMGPCTEGESRE